MPGSPRRRTSTPILALGAVVLSSAFAFSLASAASLGVTSQQLTVGQGGTPPSPPPTGDTTPPTVASVTTARSPGTGNREGRPLAGSTVTVVFSEAMKGDTICSQFSATILSRTVTATITQGSANNELSVTDCNFGTLDLGSSGFVTSDVEYAGSTLVWDGSIQVTVTLGNPSPSSGVAKHANPVTTSFTPASALTDLAGNAIQPGPYTTAGKVFG